MLLNNKAVIIALCTIIIILTTYIFWDTNHFLNESNVPDYKFQHSNKDTKDQELTYENGFNDSTDVQYLNHIRSRWIKKPSNFPRKLKNKNRKHYSQEGQSQFVDSLLQGKLNGFFIECGAGNGEALSNTLFFEVQRNWTGLLIEANPGLYRSILSLNRKVYSSNVCLNIRNMSAKQIFLSHGLVGGISDHLKDKYHAKLAKTNVVPTQCFPLDALLNAVGINHVDYFSLDVEGAEMDILKTIPYHRIRIDVIGIEYRCLTEQVKIDTECTKEKLQNIRQYFKSLKIYKEVGFCPNKGLDQEAIDLNGLDVFFQRI